MAGPTSEDAHLYLQLLEISQRPDFIEARGWVAHELDAGTLKELEAKHPAGSPGRSRLISVLGFYEGAGAIVSRGLLHEDLFFDAPLGFESVWTRVEVLVKDWQKSTKDESIFENMTWLARRHESWRASTWRPKLEAVPTDRPPTRQWGETTAHVGFTKS